jgi:hypothetical protein
VLVQNVTYVALVKADTRLHKTTKGTDAAMEKLALRIFFFVFALTLTHQLRRLQRLELPQYAARRLPEALSYARLLQGSTLRLRLSSRRHRHSVRYQLLKNYQRLFTCNVNSNAFLYELLYTPRRLHTSLCVKGII